MVRTILAIVALCLTTGIFLVNRRRKGLSYMLVDTRIFGLHEAVSRSRVQILFDGAAVTDVRLAMITIKNSGNEPIRAEDFERPLRVSWTEPANILTAEVAGVGPESLQPAINASAREIVLAPLLLNPGDWLKIKVLINQAGPLFVDARVVGVKRINRTTPAAKSTFPRKLILVAAAGTVCVIAMLVGEHFDLWVANGRAERWVLQIFFLGVLYVLLDEVVTLTSELENYFRTKNDDSE
jgi:hypothetical protein